MLAGNVTVVKGALRRVSHAARTSLLIAQRL